MTLVQKLKKLLTAVSYPKHTFFYKRGTGYYAVVDYRLFGILVAKETVNIKDVATQL